MSNDQAPESAPSDNARCSREACAKHGHPRRRRGFFRRLFGAALFFGVLVGVPWAVARAATGHGMCGHHAPPTSATELRERLGKGSEFLLDRLDATADQKARIGATLDHVAPELWALNDEREALHDGFKAALTAPTVNPEEVEALRKQGLALADDASRIAIGGLVEVAQVLTPEQREKAAEAAARFHGE